MVKTCFNCGIEIEIWDEWAAWCVEKSLDPNKCQKCGEVWKDVP
ncbi:hypothetical protein LCGC14_1201630 [marine sediment metagenome]|uniref:Uncharacterized protein n=1 Tax=marine sediment metagenome TaxID=412755 RepID=A0A0F9PLH1_9ZZZZ